ncbi:hypothetical protein COCON_G00034460 [Conger conger]|uniref:Uncharacterized protein n=1 Tax=Conger conger TaxID=82655 RepID=A0A9Q1I7H6_CONCO|nr:hypothetical protein COCON_G00034460 [Conger conger]
MFRSPTWTCLKPSFPSWMPCWPQLYCNVMPSTIPHRKPETILVPACWLRGVWMKLHVCCLIFINRQRAFYKGNVCT